MTPLAIGDANVGRLCMSLLFISLSLLLLEAGK